MKRLLATVTLSLLAAGLAAAAVPPDGHHFGTCSPTGICTACRNCSACKACKKLGGTCSVCR